MPVDRYTYLSLTNWKTGMTNARYCLSGAIPVSRISVKLWDQKEPSNPFAICKHLSGHPGLTSAKDIPILASQTTCKMENPTQFIHAV